MADPMQIPIFRNRPIRLPISFLNSTGAFVNANVALCVATKPFMPIKRLKLISLIASDFDPKSHEGPTLSS